MPTRHDFQQEHPCNSIFSLQKVSLQVMYDIKFPGNELSASYISSIRNLHCLHRDSGSQEDPQQKIDGCG